MEVGDDKDCTEKPLDHTPNKEKGTQKNRPQRRSSVATSQHSSSMEKKRNFHCKQKRNEKVQRKKLKFYAKGRKIDPLNLMGISQLEGQNSPKTESPLVGDRGVTFNPDNLRPVDVTDPLKLNNLDDDVLAVKVSAHKKKRKRRRRRTYSENDKDIRVMLDSLGQDMDTEASENELQSPVKTKKLETSDPNIQPASDEAVVDLKEDVEQHKEDTGTMEKADESSDNTTLNHQEKEAVQSKHPEKRKHQIKKGGCQEVSEEANKKQNIRFREKDKRFQYGNYNKYYGYRNPDMSEDYRTEYMKREWFEGKDCLDIGCNVGHLTLYITRNFSPKSMLGIDIDESLIKSARNNMRHYVSLSNPQAPKQSDFPISFPICLGPLAPPVSTEDCKKSFGFPYNTSFQTENYVNFEWDSISKIEQKYDFILCMSVTKWIQLNWGDDGVKKLFKKIFLSLKPGGKLLLEPQPWRSYSKKKNLTPTTRANFNAIRFKPDQFIQHLLSNEVGFATSEKLGIPKHKSQGFQRPIYLLTKGGVAV